MGQQTTSDCEWYQVTTWRDIIKSEESNLRWQQQQCLSCFIMDPAGECVIICGLLLYILECLATTLWAYWLKIWQLKQMFKIHDTRFAFAFPCSASWVSHKGKVDDLYLIQRFDNSIKIWSAQATSTGSVIYKNLKLNVQVPPPLSKFFMQTWPRLTGGVNKLKSIRKKSTCRY